MTTAAIKDGLTICVRFLNQPLVKEGVKNIAGIVIFAFGINTIYNSYRSLHSRTLTINADSPQWPQNLTKISLILSATTSRPGAFIISKMIGCVFSQSRLERAFGPNTVFAINPWHPRHVVSIAAVILALPSLYGKEWQADRKLRLMALFNLITSRPVQHLGNQLHRRLIA